ncbi:MAG: hypothetical protein KA761_06095 [Gemmatimonadaceae bacterium]|nr:hypothetical protein [Gemmatimonadaceae bacterium]
MTRRLLRAPALLAVLLATIAGACSERLDTADSCPVLCPGQQLDIIDTVLDPGIALDTTLDGFPLIGLETPLLLASRGDTLDVRTIIRFDSLTRLWTPTGDTARPVTFVDSATLQVRLFKSGVKVPNRFYVDAYDVGDTTLVDSLPANLLPFFTAGRLLGSRQVDSATFLDSSTISIPLDTARLREVVTTGAVLRIGLQVRSTESAMFYATTSDDASNGPRLRYRVSPDTAVAATLVRPASNTPRTPVNVNGDYLDYLLVARGRDPRAATRFAVGGLPTVRSYLRFNIPVWLTDSVAVLRAQLELVQDPVRGLDDDDSVTVRTQLVLAGHAMTDLNRAARLLAPPGYFVGDSIRRAPGDSGIVRVEINALFRAWRTNAGLPNIPQALVFRSDLEGVDGAGLRFFGLGAAPALRPRIRVSYVPTIRFGQP